MLYRGTQSGCLNPGVPVRAGGAGQHPGARWGHRHLPGHRAGTGGGTGLGEPGWGLGDSGDRRRNRVWEKRWGLGERRCCARSEPGCAVRAEPPPVPAGAAHQHQHRRWAQRHGNAVQLSTKPLTLLQAMFPGPEQGREGQEMFLGPGSAPRTAPSAPAPPAVRLGSRSGQEKAGEIRKLFTTTLRLFSQITLKRQGEEGNQATGVSCLEASCESLSFTLQPSVPFASTPQLLKGLLEPQLSHTECLQIFGGKRKKMQNKLPSQSIDTKNATTAKLAGENIYGFFKLETGVACLVDSMLQKQS